MEPVTQWLRTYHRDLPTRDIGVLAKQWEAEQERAWQVGRDCLGSYVPHLYKLTELKSGCNLNMWIYWLHLKCASATGDSYSRQAEPENSQNERV